VALASILLPVRGALGAQFKPRVAHGRSLPSSRKSRANGARIGLNLTALRALAAARLHRPAVGSRRRGTPRTHGCALKRGSPVSALVAYGGNFQAG
jgi:hypothetical protein